MPTRTLAAVIVALCLSACATSRPAKEQPGYPTIGSIERLDPALVQLLGPDAKIEKLAEGYEWAEGPVWVKRDNALLFSDVVKNTVHKWDAKKGQASAYLSPSGYTGPTSRG